MNHMRISSAWEGLLNQPLTHGQNHHLVMFYDEEQPLFDAVAIYTSRAIKEGEGVLLVTTAGHWNEIQRSLKASGVFVEMARARGQLVYRDAQETLDKFYKDGRMDAEAFDREVGGVLRKMTTEYAAVRVYGEMVDTLWKQKNSQATMELEKLWNDLAKNHAFTLLCGYDLNSFDEHAHEHAFQDLCHMHSHVIPAERYNVLLDSESQRRMLAGLQQQAKALESEAMRKSDAEKKLETAALLADEFFAVASDKLKGPLAELKNEIEKMKSEVGQCPESAQEAIGKGLRVCSDRIGHLYSLLDELQKLVPWAGTIPKLQ